ncbi:MAG TPA: subtype I-E CRISPR-associated endonuclease Cas1, partial [Plasticicumulans sp.]|nr:subtype I-E CRISPR-associated endonuclease Cas1 [Plasticicumulans sp.]
MLPPLKPLPMKERVSLVFLRYGELDVIDGAFVLVDGNGVRKQIPIGAIACVMLEPGTRVSPAAAATAARVGTLLV